VDPAYWATRASMIVPGVKPWEWSDVAGTWQEWALIAGQIEELKQARRQGGA
jgi:hypothetical protein